MTRQSRFAVIGLFTLVLAGFLACCVNFTTRVEFSLDSSHGVTTLDMYVFRPEVMFSPNANNVDSYSFILPAGQDHVIATQIRQYFVNRKEQAQPFLELGSIDLKIDGSGCEIRINLTSTDGHPFPANGTHRAAGCGLDKV